MTPTEYRLDDHQRRLEKVEEACGTVSVLENEVKHLAGEVVSLKTEMKGVKLAMWGLAASMIMAAVSFALTVTLGGLG